MANDGRVLIQATVIAVKDDQIIYPSCKQCYSKLQHEQYEKEWVCFKCSTVYEESKLEWRFRLCISVAEKASVTDIALFGKTLEPYFGTSAERFHRFLAKIDEDNLLEENMLLSALEETFVGQSFVFGIKSNARLKELQRYHGPTSPVCGSTVLKVKLGDYSTQSTFNSDLVAVQILSSANVSFTGNTVLYNLRTLTDFYWDSKPLCSVVNAGCKSIQECSYLPYTTFDQSDSSSYLKDCAQSGIELSYEKSCYQITFNESHLENDLNLKMGISQEGSNEKSCDVTLNKSDHVHNKLVESLELSLDTPQPQMIKSKNNQVSRPKLSTELSLNDGSCLRTIDEENVYRNVVVNPTHNLELNNKEQSLVNSKTSKDLKTAHSGKRMRTTYCDQTFQDIGNIQYDSKLKNRLQTHLTTLKSENSFEDLKRIPMPNNFDESSLEVLRNYDQDVKAHYDPSYLSYSDWDNSFNFSGLNSNIESADQKTQKLASQITMIDMPESENLDQFLRDPSILAVDCPESMQPETSLDCKPKNFCKKSFKVTENAALHSTVKKSNWYPDPLNEVSRNTEHRGKIQQNVCDMPESEDLSKFLGNDSFDDRIMNEDFVEFNAQQQYDFLMSVPKCDNSRTFQTNLNPNCPKAKIVPNCDKHKSHDALLKLTNFDISVDKPTDLSKAHGIVLNEPRQSKAGVPDCSQNKTSNQSTYLSFEACLKEIEHSELTSRSVISSQIILDNDSKKVKQHAIGHPAVNNTLGLENSNVNASAVYAISDEADKDTINFGDDSQGSMCLFSDEEDIEASFGSNSQDFPQKTSCCQILDNVNFSNFEAANVGKDDKTTHIQVNSYNDAIRTQCALKDSYINDQNLEDSAAYASTILDVEVMRNSSVHFNHDILTESLFGDSISCSTNDVSELLLGMNLKDFEVERNLYPNVTRKQDTAEYETELENQNVLALDQNQTHDPRVYMLEKKLDNIALKQIQVNELPEIKNVSLDLDFDSLDDSDILAIDCCSQKHFSGASILASKCNVVPKVIVDEDEERKVVHLKNEPIDDLIFSPSKATKNISNVGKIEANWKSPDSLDTPKDQTSHCVHVNDSQQDVTDTETDLNYSSQPLDVTEDGSMDLFDCSQSFTASQSVVKSKSQSMLTVDNSIIETIGPFHNQDQYLCLSKRVKFARRLSTVRHLNLVDIRLNMCKTSSPLTSAQNLKSCLRKSVQVATTELDESVSFQNVFSPSPVKTTRDLKLCKESGLNCYNSTPVNSNPSLVNSVFSPDLFSPG